MAELPGLATMSRSKYINLVYGDSLPDLLKQHKLTTRDLFEISTATTQCNNIIGPCDNTGCTCWICGQPIFLDNNGNPYDQTFINGYVNSGKDGSRVKFIRANRMSSDILPQCEHILPVMQAFLILGGLYWSAKANDPEEAKINERLLLEYAWSHAYCNNIKDDTNLFNDVGAIRKDHISTLLNRIYAKVPAIRKKVIKDFNGGKPSKKAPINWIKKQQANMIRTYLAPLVRLYNEQRLTEEQGLNMLASIVTPVHHIEKNLRKHLPEQHKLRQVLEDFKPETVPNITINNWSENLSNLATQRKVIPQIFSEDIKKGLHMIFIQRALQKLYDNSLKIPKGVKDRNTIQKLIVDFINELIDLPVCVAELNYPNTRNIRDIAIPNCTRKYVLNELDNEHDKSRDYVLYGIILLANQFIDSRRELFIISIIQTYILFQLLHKIFDKDGRILPIISQFTLMKPKVGLSDDNIEKFIGFLREQLTISIDILMDNIQKYKGAGKESSQFNTLYINLIQFILSSVIKVGSTTVTTRHNQFVSLLYEALGLLTTDTTNENLNILRDTKMNDRNYYLFQSTLANVENAIRQNKTTDTPLTSDEINDLQTIDAVTAFEKQPVNQLTTAEKIEALQEATQEEMSVYESGAAKILGDMFVIANNVNSIPEEDPTTPASSSYEGGYKRKTKKNKKNKKKTKRKKTRKSKRNTRKLRKK